MPSDSQRSPEYWRGRAAAAQAMLKDARDPKVRTYLAEIAREYERLATIAEDEERAKQTRAGRAAETLIATARGITPSAFYCRHSRESGNPGCKLDARLRGHDE